MLIYFCCWQDYISVTNYYFLPDKCFYMLKQDTDYVTGKYDNFLRCLGKIRTMLLEHMLFIASIIKELCSPWMRQWKISQLFFHDLSILS